LTFVIAILVNLLFTVKHVSKTANR